MNEKNKATKLSDEELFRQAVGEVIPIKKNNIIHKSQSPISILQNQATNAVGKSKNNFSSNTQVASHRPLKNTMTVNELLMNVQDSCDGYANRLVASLSVLEFNRRGVHCPLFKRLKKGQITVEEELDLHHCTVAEAKKLILGYILEAYDKGLQCVRIIHGKGHNSKEGYSLIKYAVNHWLQQVPMVRAFCSCVPKDGGTGAIYVLLDKPEI